MTKPVPMPLLPGLEPVAASTQGALEKNKPPPWVSAKHKIRTGSPGWQGAKWIAASLDLLGLSELF